MENSTKIALGSFGVAVAGLALAAVFKKLGKERASTASCVVGGCAAVAAVGVKVWTCSETSVFRTRTFKNATASRRSCRTCEETDRVSEQVLYSDYKRGREFPETELGKFARRGIDELKRTDWAKTITGQKVLAGLEKAYKRGDIREQDGEAGLQLGWGCFSAMYIGRDAIKKFVEGKSRAALVLLAHEGSHYTYATRHGLLSFWWRQYEVEGYRINDILNIEFTGRNWVGGDSVRKTDDIETFLKSRAEYKWIPKFPFGFRYWNRESVGQ